ncbi:hypothetical protein HDV00_003276 [Rhizophlyctis rosea]|nr:hypothetical protein HDV00_003276 [Rhizophlyctis rosea]
MFSHSGLVHIYTGFDPKEVTITSGADHIDSYKSTPSVVRYRCKTCGSPIGGELSTPEMKFRDICPTTLDRDANERVQWPEEWKPTEHIFYPSRMVDVKDGLPKYRRFSFDSETVPE